MAVFFEFTFPALGYALLAFKVLAIGIPLAVLVLRGRSHSDAQKAA